jgi:hypothetical protein
MLFVCIDSNGQFQAVETKVVSQVKLEFVAVSDETRDMVLHEFDDTP